MLLRSKKARKVDQGNKGRN